MERYLSKRETKKGFTKIAPEILKYSQPVWKKLMSLKNQEKILFEGAQGILLDVDHGTYPRNIFKYSCFLSCNRLIRPNSINYVLGITKAYTTRVGEGPFPTELKNNIGDQLGHRGKEFGTVTEKEDVDGLMVY